MTATALRPTNGKRWHELYPELGTGPIAIEPYVSRGFFEKERELFMRTSFTTKFLDYVAFGKPVILWGPEYCTPVRVARKHGGAAVVSTRDANAVVALCRQIAADSALSKTLSNEALQLHQTLFNPNRLQDIFVQKITELVNGRN